MLTQIFTQQLKSLQKDREHEGNVSQVKETLRAECDGEVEEKGGVPGNGDKEVLLLRQQANEYVHSNMRKENELKRLVAEHRGLSKNGQETACIQDEYQKLLEDIRKIKENTKREKWHTRQLEYMKNELKQEIVSKRRGIREREEVLRPLVGSFKDAVEIRIKTQMELYETETKLRKYQQKFRADQTKRIANLEKKRETRRNLDKEANECTDNLAEMIVSRDLMEKEMLQERENLRNNIDLLLNNQNIVKRKRSFLELIGRNIGILERIVEKSGLIQGTVSIDHIIYYHSFLISNERRLQTRLVELNVQQQALSKTMGALVEGFSLIKENAINSEYIRKTKEKLKNVCPTLNLLENLRASSENQCCHVEKILLVLNSKIAGFREKGGNSMKTIEFYTGKIPGILMNSDKYETPDVSRNTSRSNSPVLLTSRRKVQTNFREMTPSISITSEYLSTARETKGLFFDFFPNKTELYRKFMKGVYIIEFLKFNLNKDILEKYFMHLYDQYGNDATLYLSSEVSVLYSLVLTNLTSKLTENINQLVSFYTSVRDFTVDLQLDTVPSMHRNIVVEVLSVWKHFHKTGEPVAPIQSNAFLNAVYESQLTLEFPAIKSPSNKKTVKTQVLERKCSLVRTPKTPIFDRIIIPQNAKTTPRLNTNRNSENDAMKDMKRFRSSLSKLKHLSRQHY